MINRLLLVLLFLTVTFPLEGLSKEPDPVGDANKVQNEIESLEKQNLEILEKLNNELSRWAPGDWQSESRSIEQFKKLIPNLKRRAQIIMDLDVDIEDAFKKYKLALEAAPRAFRAEAQKWAKFAEDEPEAQLKGNYIELAKEIDAIGAGYGRRATQLDGLYTNIEAKRAFVERSVIFLDRLERFFELLPDDRAGAQIAAYLERLNKYIADFEGAIRSFKDFSDKLKNYGGSLPKAELPKPFTATPVSAGSVLRKQTLAAAGDSSATRKTYFVNTVRREPPSETTFRQRRSLRINSDVMKTWDDASGRHFAKAYLREITSGDVVLETATERIRVGIDKLCASDQTLIKRVARINGWADFR